MSNNKEIEAIILAAGNSTRLLPLTNDRPKPMLEIGGRPIMEYVLLTLKRGGIERVVITTHYLPQVIENYFGNGSRWGMQISYGNESELMDTAGSLALLKDQVADNVLVCGGHFVLPNLDIQDVLNFHQRMGGAGSIVLKRFPLQNLLKFFGQATLDEGQRLVGFQEKPSQRFSKLIHTTYQVYRREVLDLIPMNQPSSIPEFLIPNLLARSSTYPLYGYITSSELLNVSTLDLYRRSQVLAQQEVLHQLGKQIDNLSLVATNA